jgi:hypothetical protein
VLTGGWAGPVVQRLFVPHNTSTKTHLRRTKVKGGHWGADCGKKTARNTPMGSEVVVDPTKMQQHEHKTFRFQCRLMVAVGDGDGDGRRSTTRAGPASHVDAATLATVLDQANPGRGAVRR